MKTIRILVLTLLAVVPFAGSNAQTCNLRQKVEADDITAVRNMLEAGCDVDVKSSWGRTPLHTAAVYNRVKIAQMLIDAGANVDSQDNYDGEGPLHKAAGYNRVKIAQMLIDAGANVDSQDNYGEAPLHKAADTDRAEMAQLLIDAGANVDIQDNGDGRAPLHLASMGSVSISNRQRREDTVRVLLGANANVKLRTKGGLTPLHQAAAASVSDETSDLWRDAFGVVIRMLVDAGADVDAKEDGNGWTPLHWAFLSNRPVDAIRALVDLGADVNAQGYLGNTALHLASKWGKADVIRVLLELGADDQIKNNAKFKPKAIGKTKEIRKLLKTPGVYWPIKAYAMGNASSDLIETSARVGCADKKDCRVFLECTDKDGDEFKGSLDSASKEATAEDSIDEGATVSLSASEIKTITGATGDGALDCALRSQQRITAQVWSSTDSVNANTTAYRMSEDNEARIQFKVGESNTPFVNIRCLAAKGERCTKTKLVCTDDRGRDWPKIKAGTIDRLNVYTVSTVQGADHRINKNDKGWYSCDIESENPFMVYATHFSTKGDSRSLVSTTAVSME